MVGAGAALHREDTAIRDGLSDQRLLHRTVGSKYSRIRAILGNLARHIFADEHLGSGNACIASWVGSIFVDEQDAQFLCSCLHQLASLSESLHRHVAWEGVVHKHFCAHGVSLLGDLRAAPDIVGIQHDITFRGDYHGVFLGRTKNDQDVRPEFPHSIHSRSSTWNGLHHDNGFHIWISGHFQHVADGCLLLLHEAVRIGSDDYPICTELSLHLLGHPVFLFVLGNRTCQDSDLPVS